MLTPKEKILSLSDAAEFVASKQKHGDTVVTTNGCFDLIHAGHVLYLHQARQLGDFLVVGINSDASVQKLKGKSRPLQSETDRMLILSGFEAVDRVFCFSHETPVEWLQLMQPKIHVKGGDYKGQTIPEEAVLRQWGGRLEFLDFLPSHSTTQLIEKIKSHS